VTVEGATAAPPPTTSEFAARTPEEAHVVAPEKYGMPPEVPATVRASVPAPVTGEPETEIKPPVNVCPTEVTVPPLPVAEMVIDPVLFAIVTPVPAVSVDFVSVLPVVLPISNSPFRYVV
jgi:hypothetical protein